MQTLVKLFLQMTKLGGNPLLLNSIETDWNIQKPFYRIEAMRVVYENFHKYSCPRDFSMTIYYFSWG